MAGRKRRAGSTTTLSISLSPKDVAVLRKRAKRLHGGNVSAAIADAAELLRIDENRQAFAAKLEKELGPLDPELSRAILMETIGLIPPVRRKKTKVA
jgi:hypothetical protein